MKKIAIILGVLILFSIFVGCVTIDDNGSNNNVSIKLPDADNDGVSDSEDDFPNDPAASIDSDGDGYPDRYNEGKTQSDSTSNPPLIIDAFPNNPDEWIDSDGDFVGDNSDKFPNNPDEWSDIDSDGVGDNSDINPFADLSIEIKIDKFKVTEFVDILFWAQVYFDIKIDQQTYRIDNNKERYKAWLYQIKNVGESIFYDIDDKTDQKSTNIEILMFDYDLIGEDDQIDIDESTDKKSHNLVFDHINNQIITYGQSKSSQATIWYEIKLAENIVPDTATYDKTYKWNYKDKYFEFTIEIPIETYQNNLNSDINRIPQENIFSVKNSMKAFVTPNDIIIEEIAKKLNDFSQENNYDYVTKANFALRFVQKIISYEDDEKTKGCLEYWRLPIETLVEQKGDCEDTSVLFASIMKNMGYDVALLYYVWDEGDEKVGHLAVGVHLIGDHGDFEKDNSGKKYYYCETTTLTYYLGEIPNQVKGDVELIIPI
jgi:hypothetical protein